MSVLSSHWYFLKIWITLKIAIITFIRLTENTMQHFSSDETSAFHLIWSVLFCLRRIHMCIKRKWKNKLFSKKWPIWKQISSFSSHSSCSLKKNCPVYLIVKAFYPCQVTNWQDDLCPFLPYYRLQDKDVTKQKESCKERESGLSKKEKKPNWKSATSHPSTMTKVWLISGINKVPSQKLKNCILSFLLNRINFRLCLETCDTDTLRCRSVHSIRHGFPSTTLSLSCVSLFWEKKAKLAFITWSSNVMGAHADWKKK